MMVPYAGVVRCYTDAAAALYRSSGLDVSVLVNGVPVCFLYYPVVWVVIDGVDVVAHNAARLSMFLRRALLVVAVAALLAATRQGGMCCLRIHLRRRRFVSRSTRGPEM